MTRAGVSDDQLLRMLQQVEEREDLVDAVREEAEALRDQPAAEACPACGVPSENRGSCHVCSEEGCLPQDLWSPGDADPCLTLCVRCARTVHLGCATDDQAGNPRCPTCKF